MNDVSQLDWGYSWILIQSAPEKKMKLIDVYLNFLFRFILFLHFWCHYYGNSLNNECANLFLQMIQLRLMHWMLVSCHLDKYFIKLNKRWNVTRIVFDVWLVKSGNDWCAFLHSQMQNGRTHQWLSLSHHFHFNSGTVDIFAPNF